MAPLPVRRAHRLGPAPTRAKGNRLLVTLMLGPARFETRLLEIPEGRVLWTTDSGPWSRFSWDGQAVLLGLRPPGKEAGLLLTALPVEADIPPATLAPWDEKGLPPPPRGWPTARSTSGTTARTCPARA